jgi:hypothetical protein
MADAPIMCRWDGEAMVPATAFWSGRADKQWVIGEVYKIAEHHDRSQVSHNHEFASIAEAWKTLPERYRNEPWAQSAEHLRKFALIKARFCDTQTFTCGSRAEAERWAKNLRPLDEYSIVSVEGATVYRFTAQSQSKRAMGPARFQESKQAVLDFIADLLDVTTDDLNSARAA